MFYILILRVYNVLLSASRAGFWGYVGSEFCVEPVGLRLLGYLPGKGRVGFQTQDLSTLSAQRSA
jgi:hypothetical protein